VPRKTRIAGFEWGGWKAGKHSDGDERDAIRDGLENAKKRETP